MNIKHIAIIMDGNGRWAKRRGLARIEGHRAGAMAARRATKAAGRMGIPHLTLYALSTENLYRPQQELDGLMMLMRHYLDNEVPVLLKNDIRLNVIGDCKPLPKDLARKIREAEKETAKSFKMTLTLALCYGGRDELVRAVRTLSGKGGTRITEKSISLALDTSDMPDPDLLIRTGGDMRVSNFLLWQIAYSELYFTKKLWPDFGGADLKRAVQSFEKRQRRFGRTDEALEKQAGERKRGKLR